MGESLGGFTVSIQAPRLPVGLNFHQLAQHHIVQYRTSTPTLPCKFNIELSNYMNYCKLTYRFPSYPSDGQGISFKFARTEAEAKERAQKALRVKAEFLKVELA